MAWRCVRNGTVRGPLTVEQMEELFLAQKITEETLVSHAEHTGGKWLRLFATPLYQSLKERGERQRPPG